jgi:hypothetical protein
MMHLLLQSKLNAIPISNKSFSDNHLIYITEILVEKLILAKTIGLKLSVNHSKCRK